MKNKIKAALQQGHKNLGLSDEVFERVAEAAQTFITDEAQIATFVEGAKPMLQMYQSAADKVRTELNGKITALEGEKADLEAKLNGNNQSQQQQQQGQQSQEQSQDLAKTIADAVAAAIKPISDELATFKGEQSAKAALAAAEGTFKSNDYVKKYADEATDAWERAIEMYEATGKKWTADELNERAMGYFNKAVAKKGVDTTKPFKSDGGGGNETPDFSSFDRAVKDLGWGEPETK